jgi:hypothetical protein
MQRGATMTHIKLKQAALPREETFMKKPIEQAALRVLLPALAGLLVLGTCNLENQASDFGLAPANVYGNTGGTVERQAVSAHACCESWPATYTTDGKAAWAVDGNFTRWWHSNYTAGHPSYSVDTSETGHTGDTTNYLIRGDSEREEGYTWTADAARATPDWLNNPMTVGGHVAQYVPNGAHWITLDMGKTVTIGADQAGRLGYYRRASATGGLGQPGVSYEIYVSNVDFGWVVESALTDRITLVASGAIANNAGYTFITIDPATAMSFRYLQLRWVFDASTGTANDSRTACAANITLKVMSRELDYTYLQSVYFRGMELLQTLPVNTHNHRNLKNALTGAVNLLKPPSDPTETDTLEKTLTYQERLDTASDDLLTLIYKIDPPQRPPEVTL